jgi:hypothetical protein
VDALIIAKAVRGAPDYDSYSSLRWYKAALENASKKIGKGDAFFYDNLFKWAVGLRKVKLDDLAGSLCRWALSQKAHAIESSFSEVDRVVKEIKKSYPPETAVVTETTVNQDRSVKKTADDAIFLFHCEIKSIIDDLDVKWQKGKGTNP